MNICNQHYEKVGYAESIEHLLVKYESDWYADEELNKWNDIDDRFEEERSKERFYI